MAIWEGPAEAREEIRTFVSGIVARLSPSDAVAEARVIRYEAQEKGAAIIVDDSDTERLDKLRSEFELLANELKEGSCDVALSMARNRSQTASNYEDLASPN